MSGPHYAGAVTYRGGRGSIVNVAAGWAACCSGDRARKIRQNGDNTHDRGAVKCPRCLGLLAKGDAYAAGHAAPTA